MDRSATTNETHPWLRHYPDGVSWQAPLPPQSMTALFEEAVER